MSAVVERRPLAHRTRTAPPALADRAETPLIAVPAHEVDDTFIGVQVLVVGFDRDRGAVRAWAGGISDVQQYRLGDPYTAPCGATYTLPAACTRLWVGGHVLFLRGDAVVLTTPPPAALAVS